MIWIIGAGGIAREYAKVLKTLGKEFICISRGEEKAKEFEMITGAKTFSGGLDTFIATKPQLPDDVIVATNTMSLASNLNALINYGVKRVFCEKPGFFSPKELDILMENYHKGKTEVFIAYNRRFYASSLAAERIIEEDGGLLSFNFEFTEWAHVFEQSDKPKDRLANLFYTNSSHVFDLAFFVGGKPVEMGCFSKDDCGWHKPANFAGAGLTDKGVLFSYNANWNAPGRWAVEFLTAKHRIYLKPMEQLQLQDKGSVKVYPVEIDDHLDKEFKPGFYLETKAFLDGDTQRLCTLEEQVMYVNDVYKKMMGQ